MASMGLAGGVPMSAHSDVLEAAPDTLEGKQSLLEEIKNRARAAIGSKNYMDAERLYNKGLTLVDDSSQKAILYANLSLVERNMGMAEGARKSAESAVELDPTYVKGYWRLGQALSSLHRTQEALDAFSKALELDPTNKALIKECDKLKKQMEEEQDLMDVETPPAAAPLEPVKKPAPPAKKTTTKPKTKSTPIKVDDEDSSDLAKGYKVVNGKKTSYFHNELSEEDKRLIGDIAPKKLDPVQTTSAAPAAVEGASAWNKAGTWEERDVTAWATDTLKASILSTSYIFPDSSPDPGAVAKVTAVPKLDGHASFATVRGKKRYIYEFSVQLNWELELSNGDECSGKMSFPDVDGTCELDDGYDMADFYVNAGAPGATAPLLDRFVKNGGLRDALHKCLDDWVRLFRATY